MLEKRRFKRIPAHLTLTISSIFKQNNIKVDNIEAPITVINVSRSGIGFISKGVFPEGFYFNAALQLGSSEDDILYCVVKILRSQVTDEPDVYSYGCEFVGMPSVFNYIFDEFEAAAEAAEQNK